MELATLVAMATTVTSVIFNEAIKEAGKNAGKGTSELVGKLWDAVSEKFKKEKTEGLLPSVQNQPNEFDKKIFEQKLQSYMNQDPTFAATLNDLLEKLKLKQTLGKSIEMGTDIESKKDVEFKGVRQKDKSSNAEKMKLGTNIKSDGSVTFTNVDQEG
jgi:hypothetical protein